MRSTWISGYKNGKLNSYNVKTIFVVAIHSTHENLGSILKEAKNNSDMLIIDLQDSYNLHTIKTVALMEYFVEQCLSEFDDFEKKRNFISK